MTQMNADEETGNKTAGVVIELCWAAPLGTRFHFFDFKSVFHPCFIPGSRISCFDTFEDECSNGGEEACPIKCSVFTRRFQGSATPD